MILQCWTGGKNDFYSVELVGIMVFNSAGLVGKILT